MAVCNFIYATDSTPAACDETLAVVVGKTESNPTMLQQAIATAENGDTVKLIQGGKIVITNESTFHDVDGYGTYAALVDEKAVILDLNGKAIECEVYPTNLASFDLVAFFATDDKDEDGIEVNIFGTLSNYGTIDASGVNVAVRLVTNIVEKNGVLSKKQGIFNGTGSVVNLTVPSNVYSTDDGDTFETLTSSGTAVMLQSNGEVSFYADIKSAYDAANDGDTIVLLENIVGEGLVINKDITINFNTKTWTINKCVGSAGTKTLGLQILKGNDVVLKNGTLAAAEITPSETEKPVKMLVQNYANLTLVDLALDAEDYANTKYALQKVESKKFSGLGSKYKISSDRRLGYALKLIEDLKQKFELVPISVQPQDYALPYEPIEVLIEKGLVKDLSQKK